VRIYTLTQLGQSLGKTPAKEMTPGWRVVYFLRRHGNQATDEQIMTYTGIEPGAFRTVINNLKGQKVVAEVV
jgi:transcription initiation factor IIE alpha subunit